MVVKERAELKSDFINLLYRMRYVKRWSGTTCIDCEDAAQHSFNVTVITHLLCHILKSVYHISINIEHALSSALYHDCTDTILTHIISPVKNDNAEIKDAISNLKYKATQHISSMLPEVLQISLDNLLKEDELVKEVIEMADIIDTYCKSSTELKKGNLEFKNPYDQVNCKLKSVIKSKPYIKTFYDLFLLDFSKSELSYKYLK